MNTCTKTILAPTAMTGEWLRSEVETAKDGGFLNIEVLVSTESRYRTLLTNHGFRISGSEQRNLGNESTSLVKWRLKVQDFGDGLA